MLQQLKYQGNNQLLYARVRECLELYNRVLKFIFCDKFSLWNLNETCLKVVLLSTRRPLNVIQLTKETDWLMIPAQYAE